MSDAQYRVSLIELALPRAYAWCIQAEVHMRTEQNARLVWSNDFQLLDIERNRLTDRVDESDLTYAFDVLLDDPEVREVFSDFMVPAE